MFGWMSAALVAAMQVSAGEPVAAPSPVRPYVYLSDVLYGIAKYGLDYGRVLGLDTTSYPLWPKAIPGDPISLGGHPYEKGVGAPPGDVIVALDGEYSAFEAVVGVQDGDTGTAIFRVVVDGEVRFDSGVVEAGSPVQHIRVSLEGAQQMALNAGSTARANWADAKLYRVEDRAPAAGPDMAPFARTVTWDPARMDGVRVDRLTEFPAEDLFLETDLAPAQDGAYDVPRSANGEACIGLQWPEARKLQRVALDFAAGSAVPEPETVRVEAWVRKDPLALDGYSPWQGKWVGVEGEVRARDGGWDVDITGAANRHVAEGTYKVRWVFASSEETVRVARLRAYTTSRWAEAALTLEAVDGSAGTANLELYNGEFVDGSASVSWEMSRPLALALRYTTPRPWQLDRTVLRVRTPNHAFGVAVDDVLAHDIVYIESAGVCARTDAGDLQTERARVEAGQTILEQVRQLPDQTLAKALEANYLPVQDRSPTMLSLLADNRKVIVQRSGEVGFGPTYLDFVQQRSRLRLSPTFGSGTQHDFPDSGVGDRPGYSRRLDGGWLPMPHIRVEDGGAVYDQVVFVAPWDQPGGPAPTERIHPTPVCVAEYRIGNPSETPVDVSLRLKATADAEAQRPASIVAAGDRWAVMDGERVTAVIDAPPAPLTSQASGDTLEVGGPCPAGATLAFYAYMPLEWTPTPEDLAALSDGAALRRRTEQYWRDFDAAAMQVDIPDEMLGNLLKASQVHCTLAARNEADGERIDAWISSSYYASLDTESHAILHGMDLWGQHDFARRTLAFFLERHKPEGYLSHGYTLVGTGQHLWWASDRFRLTRDEAWWREVLPKIERMCRWVAAQTEKTKHRDASGDVVPQYGLVPPGTVADWQDWGCIYSQNGYYYAGLAAAAEAMRITGDACWSDFAQAAEEHRANILRAYDWTVARMPVVKRRDGAWIPGSPFQALCPGPSTQFFPNYPIAWIYDAELGAHQLVDQGVLTPDDARAANLADDLEDRHFLEGAFGAITPELTQADWFNRGGFGRAQPFYGRFVQMHARRDDVKPFIRSYLNQLGVMVNREDLTIYENPGASVWNKTFETGNFLQQSRLIFVQERGEELWLAPFVTTAWLSDGMHVAVSQAPTLFGDTAYAITSHAASGRIDARISPPERAQRIVIRLRHPAGAPLVRAEVVGATAEVDPSDSTVHLTPTGGEITVCGYFE